MSDGVTVRCQAVSKSKLRKIRVAHGLDPEDKSISPDDVWPEAQCEHPAVHGKLLCGGTGGHGGGSLSVPTYDYLDFMPVDLREKVQMLIDNPQILSRRMEIIQLMGRILVLYEKVRDKENLGIYSLDHIREGLDDIDKGDIDKGRKKIQATLDSRLTEAEAYAEIRQTMSLLKDMTKVEVGTLKETNQTVPFDIFMSSINAVGRAIQEAVEKYVPEERTRELIVGFVDRTIARRFNTRLPRILPDLEEAIEADYTETE